MRLYIHSSQGVRERDEGLYNKPPGIDREGEGKWSEEEANNTGYEKEWR